MAEDFSGRTCPYDQAVIKPGQDIVVCSQCGVAHHKECWEANSGCTTVGCSGTPEAVAPDSRSHGTTKACPYCAEEIQAAAKFCKHCRQRLPSADKPRLSDLIPDRRPPLLDRLLLPFVVPLVWIALVCATGLSVFVAANLERHYDASVTATVNHVSLGVIGILQIALFAVLLRRIARAFPGARKTTLGLLLLLIAYVGWYVVHGILLVHFVFF